MNPDNVILNIAVPAPIFRTFDYLPMDQNDAPPVRYLAGQRVLVPFGNRSVIGIIVEIKTESNSPSKQLKAITKIFEHDTILNKEILKLARWAANYYCHPLGECLQAALPTATRQKNPLPEFAVVKWHRTDQKFNGPRNATVQMKILDLIASQPSGVWQESIKAMGFKPAQLKTLEQKGYLYHEEHDPITAAIENTPLAKPVKLNPSQKKTADDLTKSLGSFRTSLLQGVTGSGKTEVYIELVSKTLEKKMQALVLVPEINLTPQTFARFQTQLATPIGTLHSGMTEREKFTTWSLAKQGIAKVVIGTRSAIFTPFENLGLIIVDEEHDQSYKQMDGFKYSARDLAVKRAQLENCNVVLGSATPSLESSFNAINEKYQWFHLRERAGAGKFPKISLIDIRSRPLADGCSPPLLEKIKLETSKGNQVIVFQNRRGYSPAIMCYDCGWLAQCRHCDARMTVHASPPHLHCHHCDNRHGIPKQCPNCQGTQLNPVGTGTERIEYGLTQRFPEIQVLRVDRDSIKNQRDMEHLIEQINQGEPCLIIGTQMLAKGHDFHHVTLVAIIDADGIFFSSDFRAMERGAQQLLQVAGRTGRGEKHGEVLIQTRQPDHPIFDSIIAGDYDSVSNIELDEREVCELPPYSKMISIRADSKCQSKTFEVLQQIQQHIRNSTSYINDIQISGPIEALIARKQGSYRSYLHLFIESIEARKQILSSLPALIQNKSKANVRVSVDVDPLEYL